jgi:hypothetical protein
MRAYRQAPQGQEEYRQAWGGRYPVPLPGGREARRGSGRVYPREGTQRPRLGTVHKGGRVTESVGQVPLPGGREAAREAWYTET